MAQAGTARVQWPSPEDWKRVRPIIKRLYVDEDRGLKEVMHIMSNEHGHRGTVKMYKSRLATWNLRKYNQEADMLFILRKKNQRDRVGKRTKVLVHGRVVHEEEIRRYFIRKGGVPSTLGAGPHTPPHISYRTPSPTMILPRSRTSNVTGHVPAVPRQSTRPSSSNTAGKRLHPYLLEEASLGHSAEAYPDSEHALDNISINELLYIVSGTPQLHIQVSTPPTFYLPEYIFFSINSYFDRMLQELYWVTHENGYLMNPKALPASVNDPDTFYEYFHTAICLIKSKSYLEARRILSCACEKARDLLQAEDPRTLDYLLNTYLYLLREGHQEILGIIRSYISNMAFQLGITTQPWGNIIRLLGMVPPDQLEATIIQAWSCTTAAFERHLGRFHESTMECYLEFIDRAFPNRAETEPVLRRLLSECEQVYGLFSSRTFSVMVKLGYNLYYQQSYAGAEIVGTELLARAHTADSYLSQIHGLELAARAQYYQNKITPAGENLLAAAVMIGRRWGDKEPWKIKNLVRLESWLRDWGRLEEADAMHETIDGLVGRDGAD